MAEDFGADEIDGTFALNDAVLHATFGPGEVTRVERDVVAVRFEMAGHKTFALPEVVDNGLLVKRAADEV